MLHEHVKRIEEIRTKTIEIFDDLLISQKLALQALEDCDNKGYEQVGFPLKEISGKLKEIDHLILTVVARFTPEAKDLREMVAFLKITFSIERILNNQYKYIKNMEICNPTASSEIKKIVFESLAINRCTIKAMEYVQEMIGLTDDQYKLRDLASKVHVESSKADDIYSILEKDILQHMGDKHLLNEDHIRLLKYIRKNDKILDRLEDIASRLIFARIGEEK